MTEKPTTSVVIWPGSLWFRSGSHFISHFPGQALHLDFYGPRKNSTAGDFIQKFPPVAFSFFLSFSFGCENWTGRVDFPKWVTGVVLLGEWILYIFKWVCKVVVLLKAYYLIKIGLWRLTQIFPINLIVIQSILNIFWINNIFKYQNYIHFSNNFKWTDCCK